MRKKKSIIAMAIILSVVFLLSACSGANNSDRPSSPSVPSSPSASGDEQVSIVFAEHVANVKDQAPQVWAVIQAFEKKYPNIKIDLQGSSSDDHLNKIKLASQSDTLPDLFWVDRALGLELVDAGQLGDLSVLVEDQNFADGFLPNMLDALQVDNKIYGFPSEIQCNGLWYNKRMFEERGLEVPKTYEELVECVKVFNKEGIATIALGGKSAFSDWALQTWSLYYSFEEKIDDILDGKEKFNNPDFAKTYEKVRELTELGAFPESVANIDYWQSIELFLGGQAAMLSSGAWDTKKFDQSDMAEDIDFYWGPTFDDATTSTFADKLISMKGVGHPYVVSQNCAEDPAKFDAVSKFLQFYYGPEGTEIIARDNQSIPVTKYEGEIDAKTYPVFSRMMKRINDDSTSPVRAPEFCLPAQLVPAYQESFFSIIFGTKTPEQVLDGMDSLLKDIS